MPVMKVHFCPLRAKTPRTTKNAVAHKFINNPTIWPEVPRRMAIAAASSVMPNPPRKIHVLPLMRLTVFTTDKPPIRNSQFAPLCNAAVVSAWAAALADGNGLAGPGDERPRPLMVLLLKRKLVRHYAHRKEWLASKKKFLKLLSDLFRPPDQHFKGSGKMQQGLGIGQVDARGLRHGVDIKLSFRILQLPGQMMDVGAQNAAPIDGIEAVALGKKSFD